MWIPTIASRKPFSGGGSVNLFWARSASSGSEPTSILSGTGAGVERGKWMVADRLANQGAHLLDLISWFMGDFESAYGEMAIMNHDIETEDIGLAIVNFKSGAKGVIVGTTTFPTSVYFSAEVHGTEGGILVDDVLGGKMRVFGEGLEERLQQIENPIHSIIEDFVQAFEEGGDLRVDGREGRRTVALLEKIYQSAREGKVLNV